MSWGGHSQVSPLFRLAQFMYLFILKNVKIKYHTQYYLDNYKVYFYKRFVSKFNLNENTKLRTVIKALKDEVFLK